MDTGVRVLFLCTGNSCRSQMAEGLARAVLPARIGVYSAGIEKHGLNTRAVAVMQEIGIDISAYKSKTVEEMHGIQFDYVITVCGHAHETCPVFPATTAVIHRGFDDPPFLTQDMQDEQDILNVYRRVRDELRAYVRTLPSIFAKK